jgi:hypothetical protein
LGLLECTYLFCGRQGIRACCLSLRVRLFTVFCEWYVGCGLWQDEKEGRVLLDSVQGLAVLCGIGCYEVLLIGC